MVSVGLSLTYDFSLYDVTIVHNAYHTAICFTHELELSYRNRRTSQCHRHHVHCKDSKDDVNPNPRPLARTTSNKSRHDLE